MNDTKGTAKEQKEDIMYVARANHFFIRVSPDKRLDIYAFLSTFHPGMTHERKMEFLRATKGD